MEMEPDLKEALKRLKRDFLEQERVCRNEKESLISAINTFGVVVAMDEEMVEQVQAVRKLATLDKELPLDEIEKEISRLKDKIIAKEGEMASVEGDPGQPTKTEERLLEACRIVRKIMFALLEDFYPMSNELEDRAKAIDIKCKGDIAEIRLKEPTSAFLSFIEGLKARISEDFKYINETFLTLLEHVKELEKTLRSEFGEKDRLKEIESFEIKVNTEVGSIVNSFNLYTTINEIKGAVVEKIKSIKRLVSLKKKEEIKRAQAAKENIKKLKKQINEAEKDASEMSKKVERFQTVALKDGLTGLYNRKAFDTRVKSALKGFNEMEQPFSIVLFDVDKFKEINDTFGHVAGDTILKKVSQCLMETFRKNDFIARYGGDEFVVVIENLTREMAGERILNFRKNLRKRRFTSYAKGDVSLTVSSGIALVEEGDTLESLIIRADKAMYASKKKKN